MGLFSLKYGVIPALDESNPKRIGEIVKQTHDVKGIVGYKVSGRLALRKGLEATVNAVREHTEDLPIILDYQKAGTDVPFIERLLIESNYDLINGVIFFPQSGTKSQKELIDAAKDKGIVPIAGGFMTHPEYIEEEDGYIPERNVDSMYLNSVKWGVNHFIVPGNKPDVIREYKELLSTKLSEIGLKPVFAGPGIGKDAQGGDIDLAIRAAKPYSFQGIVGRAIRKAEKPKEAATGLCKKVLSYK